MASGFSRIPDNQSDYDLYLPCPVGTFSNTTSKGKDGCTQCPPGIFFQASHITVVIEHNSILMRRLKFVNLFIHKRMSAFSGRLQSDRNSDICMVRFPFDLH